MKLEHSLTSHTKKFKVEDLKQDAIKLLEENTGKTFSDINHSNIFLDKSSKAKYIETKMYKYDLIKLISFYLAKTTNKMRQFMKREKIFANDDPNKGLISKTYKHLKQINIETKQHQAELSVLYRSFPLAIYFIRGSVYMSKATPSICPTFSLSHCVHESILYICISILPCK